VQRDAAAPTMSSKKSNAVPRSLFSENTTNVGVSKKYITQQQLMSKTRNQKKFQVTTVMIGPVQPIEDNSIISFYQH
jgi:hypothetical protein